MANSIATARASVHPSRCMVYDVHVLAAWAADCQEIERCAAVLEAQPEAQARVVESWAREVRGLLADPGVEELVARVADALEAHGDLDETLFEDCLG